MAMKEGRLAKPDRLGQVHLMARLELEVDQVGLRPADADHLVGRGGQGRDIRVDHVDRPGGPIASRSNHAAGSSQTSSFAETSKRLNSKNWVSLWLCPCQETCQLLAMFPLTPSSLHLELKPLLADLELGQRFDRDLRHPQPQSVGRLVMLGVPGPARARGTAARAAARRTGHPAGRSGTIGSEPIQYSFLTRRIRLPISDADQLGDSRRPERAGALIQALSFAEARLVPGMVDRRPCVDHAARRTDIARCRPETRPCRPEPSCSRGRTSHACSGGR